MRTWFVGFDGRDDIASRVAIRSMRRHVRDDVRVVLLRDHELRQRGFFHRAYEVMPNGQRIDSRDGKPFSTDFSFTRFCVPELARAMGIHEPVLFTDPDVLLRTDINEAFDAWDDRYAVMCVQHDHKPKELEKMGGLEQTKYFRKNWSSVMLLHPDKTKGLSSWHVNNRDGAWLHALLWAEDNQIGALDKKWNHLVGYDEPRTDAALVHFTLGDPLSPGRANDEHADEWRSYLTPTESENPFEGITAPKPAGWKQYA